jgi:hypothetical protein
MVIGGIFWTLAYLLIIRQGFKDKTYGMPLAALCANISWEAIFAFIHPHRPPQLYINYGWFALDVVIVLQFLKFGKEEFSKLTMGPVLFRICFCASTVLLYDTVCHI